MNKKRKILTMLALAMFGAIIALHYQGLPYYRHSRMVHRTTSYRPAAAPFAPLPPIKFVSWDEFWGGGIHTTSPLFENDVRMPLFVLAVFYAGLFSLLGGERKTK